jgi:hypothetical protein
VVQDFQNLPYAFSEKSCSENKNLFAIKKIINLLYVLLEARTGKQRQLHFSTDIHHWTFLHRPGRHMAMEAAYANVEYNAA